MTNCFSETRYLQFSKLINRLSACRIVYFENTAFRWALESLLTVQGTLRLIHNHEIYDYEAPIPLAVRKVSKTLRNIV